MICNETNERYVYQCSGYRVDLMANDGAMECECMSWQCDKGPALRRGAPPFTKATMCKHCKKALWDFVRELLPKLSAMDGGGI